MPPNSMIAPAGPGLPSPEPVSDLSIILFVLLLSKPTHLCSKRTSTIQQTIRGEGTA
jgi:hypothetical protein